MFEIVSKRIREGHSEGHSFRGGGHGC